MKDFSLSVRGSVTLLSTVLALLLTGCSGGEVPMEPADNANDPACADMMVRLPSTVAEQDRRMTNAQSTGAWGDPVVIELRCGIESTGPSTDACVNVDGIDWVIDDSAAPLYRFEAYGRTPGVEVFADNNSVAGVSVLTDLSSAVGVLPQTRQCVNLSDTIDVE